MLGKSSSSFAYLSISQGLPMRDEDRIAKLKRRVEELERELSAMREQQTAMAALYRGAQPTAEGRRVYEQWQRSRNRA